MTIKETAGKMLLYLYQLQRTVPSSMQYRQLGFIDKADGKVGITSDKKWLTRDLLDISPQSSDVFNGFVFLIDKGFIRSRERSTSGARIYVGLHLTATGIDVIEGVEHGTTGKDVFASTFNIPVDESMNVETLIQDNVGALLK